MKSKLVYVPKTDPNQINESFQLLKKMELEELEERCSLITAFQPKLTSKPIKVKNTLLGFGLTVTHYTGFISIEGSELSDIIEAAWIIDTGKSFEDNLIDEMND